MLRQDQPRYNSLLRQQKLHIRRRECVIGGKPRPDQIRKLNNGNKENNSNNNNIVPAPAVTA